MVKFLNTNNDLTKIEIVLTDFGLAGTKMKGGTPIFASPDCLANSDRKNNSDIFSLGRVFLLMISTINQFLKFLFVPISDQKSSIQEEIQNEPVLNLCSKMMQVKNRIQIEFVRSQLYVITRFKNLSSLVKISQITSTAEKEETKAYIDHLEELS